VSPFGPGGKSPRIEARGDLRLAQIDTEAEVMAGKADAINYVGWRALQNVALLSQMEQQLAQAVTLASGRLAAIADMTALAMSASYPTRHAVCVESEEWS
jgi:hypothetical protein